MASSLWPAVSGATAQQHAVDTVANNLANANTDGFKKDLPTFREYLAAQERINQIVDIPPGPIKDKDLYPLDGRDQSFVVVNGTYTNFSQGNLKVTDNPLDLALDGKGFFEVSTPSGIRYTKHGSFKLATDGRLVTKEGYPVLASQGGGLVATALPAEAVQPSQGGLTTQGGVGAEPYIPPPDVVARYINLRDLGPNLSVSTNGEVFAGDQKIANLSIVEFADAAQLRKAGDQLFTNPDPANRLGVAERTLVRQGMIETSNVNPVEEMTNLIKAHRLFEHDMKAIKTYDDLMGKEVNDIGKL